MIDRMRVVRSHNPVLHAFETPLSVGNGDFAFTADLTGLQTMPEAYEPGFPLCTMASWGTHTENPGLFGPGDCRPVTHSVCGKPVALATSPEGQTGAWEHLRMNPHRFHLGRIGLFLDGRAITPGEITLARQELDLFEGVLHSAFTLAGQAVSVRTAADPDQDAVAFVVTSPLLAEKRLSVRLCFPYASPAMSGADWSRPDAHVSRVAASGVNSARVWRKLDAERYFCALSWENMTLEKTERHALVFTPDASSMSLTALFTRDPAAAPRPARDVMAASAASFAAFWQSGGFIDFSRCTDARARELSRRAILSQYLTRIQCAGAYPPAETGLTLNSWYGKPHLEMHFWHAHHFALFGRPELLEKSLWWYASILDSARERAAAQGFLGARWPKMTSHEGEDSPSGIGPLLLWQQPHPIVYAHALLRAYRARGDDGKARTVLKQYWEIVRETADCMASIPASEAGRFVLGRGVIPAQENHKPADTLNPVYELEYWRHGLTLAIEWAGALGLSAPTGWLAVRARLSPLPVDEGAYPAHELCPTTDTFSRYAYDHPSFLCALGVLPGKSVHPPYMEKSLRLTLAHWNRERLWGWDFPVMAMTCVRLGLPELALSCLLMDSPKNTYLKNGHNAQIPRADLPLYLPGNGGLLLALALMCAGYDGCREPLPGFPKDGAWDVRFEGILPQP